MEACESDLATLAVEHSGPADLRLGNQHGISAALARGTPGRFGQLDL